MRWRASLCVSLAPSAENSRSTSSTELRSLSKRSWSRRFQQSRQACTQHMARTGARRRSVDTDAGAAVYCAAAPACMHVTPGSRGATRPHACNRSLFLLFDSARVIQSEKPQDARTDDPLRRPAATASDPPLGSASAKSTSSVSKAA